jgi:hypothetical protein
MAADLLDRWLTGRLAGVPAELGAQVRASLEAREPANSVEDVSAAFGEAALRGLDRVRAGRQSRGDALHLLAADACLTYAFEVAADLDGDSADVAKRFGIRGDLGTRLTAAMAERSGAK